MIKREITDNIINMIRKRKGVYVIKNIADNIFNIPNFLARDLVYLLYELEKEYNIKIEKEDIVNGKFKSIEDISECVMKCS